MSDDFHGDDYIPELDGARLASQISRIFRLMCDGCWRTLSEISAIVRAPEASVSAQLRALRREKYGGHTVNKRRRGDPRKGLFEYQLIPKVKETEP